MNQICLVLYNKRLSLHYPWTSMCRSDKEADIHCKGTKWYYVNGKKYS
jgi:hypothetical protein